MESFISAISCVWYRKKGSQEASYVPVNSKTAHSPTPPGKPWGIWLFWNILVKFPAMLPV